MIIDIEFSGPLARHNDLSGRYCLSLGDLFNTLCDITKTDGSCYFEYASRGVAEFDAHLIQEYDKKNGILLSTENDYWFGALRNTARFHVLDQLYRIARDEKEHPGIKCTLVEDDIDVRGEGTPCHAAIKEHSPQIINCSLEHILEKIGKMEK
ncbi:MAG: hypothetical protein ABIA21_01400 [Candidatus Aenigmatarchaeota archaeon]